jgi:hypothetical protein
MADHDAQIAPIRDMRQRVGLFARKDKTARFCTRQRRPPVGAVYLMVLPLCHDSCGSMQALFRFDHGVRREAIFSASVLAKFDQIGRLAHRTHDPVELLDPFTVPMRKLRHVALRERRLLMRDRVQGDRRIGDDAFAVAACDLAVQFGAVGLVSFALDALRGCADLVLRL